MRTPESTGRSRLGRLQRPAVPFDEAAVRKQLDELTAGLKSAVREIDQTSREPGEILSLLLQSPDHADMPLGQVRTAVLCALEFGTFALARATSKSTGLSMPAGVVIWANVSEAVSARLTRDEGGISKADWNSGDVVWIVLTGGDKQVCGALVRKLTQQRWNGRQVCATPMNIRISRNVAAAKE
jgi:hemolysin-activating ACP:hemolysin acyltransferase